jgi:hypothetical protein
LSAEAEESPLLEAVTRERLVKKQQALEGLVGAVVICKVWRKDLDRSSSGLINLTSRKFSEATEKNIKIFIQDSWCSGLYSNLASP